MGLESGTYISDLVVTNPLGSDAKADGDGHLRLIKATLKTTFPNVTGAVTSSHAELNVVDGHQDAVTVTPIAGVAWDGELRKITTKFWALSGTLTNASGGALTAGGGTKWADFPGTLLASGSNLLPAISKGDASVTAMHLALVQNGGNIEICPYKWDSALGYGGTVANGAVLYFNGIILLS